MDFLWVADFFAIKIKSSLLYLIRQGVKLNFTRESKDFFEGTFCLLLNHKIMGMFYKSENRKERILGKRMMETCNV